MTYLDKTRETFQHHMNRLKTLPAYVSASDADKTCMITTMAAMLLSYSMAPLPSDRDTVIRQFTQTDVIPFWEDILNWYNEIDIIRITDIIKMAERMYMNRWAIAYGNMPINVVAAIAGIGPYVTGDDRDMMKGLCDAINSTSGN